MQDVGPRLLGLAHTSLQQAWFCSAVVQPTLKPQATLEQLPTESLKRIRETYKAFKAAAASTAAAAAVAAPAQMQQQVAGQVRRYDRGATPPACPHRGVYLLPHAL